MSNSALPPRPTDRTSGTGNRYLRWAYYALLVVGVLVAIGIWARGFRLAAEAAARSPFPEPKPPPDGTWVALDGSGSILKFDRGTFTVSKGGKIEWRGVYFQHSDYLIPILKDSPRYFEYYGVHPPWEIYYDITDDNLAIWDSLDHVPIIFSGKMPPQRDRVVRFRRVKD